METALNRYDAFGRLVESEITKDGARTLAQYTYNASGYRTSKTVNGVTTEHVLDGANVAADVANGQVTQYVRGLGLTAMVQADGTRLQYVTDGHGDVKKLISGSGTVVADYTYDAFGNQTKEAEDVNPFRYAGEYYDAETGLIYLRARYYDSGVGAFASADTHWNIGNMIYGDDNTGIPSIAAIMQSGNLYVYCGGNPINRYDITGCNWFSDRWNDVKWAFETIGNYANEAQKATQRSVWAAGAELYLRGQKDYQTSAWMLEHSLQDNPSDIWRGNDSRIAYLINHDEAFSIALDNVLQSQANNKDGYFSVSGISVTFTTGDLYYSIHRSTFSFVGYRQNDGSWMVNAIMHDKYDYTQILTFMGDNGGWSSEASLGTVANDAAYISQKTGAIVPYYVTVDFWAVR